MSDLGAKSSKLDRMLKDPLPLIGMTGFLGIVGYSLYNYRKKAQSTKPSVYVIQTRVAAQALVIGVLTFGIGYRMVREVIDAHVNHHHVRSINPDQGKYD